MENQKEKNGRNNQCSGDGRRSYSQAIHTSKNMYANEKPAFDQMCDPAYRRAQNITIKSGAVFVAFNELGNLINNAALSRQYFGRSPSWLTQRINGNMVFNKKAGFRPDEYHQLAEAFRNIAARLMTHADEIDNAAPDPIS